MTFDRKYFSRVCVCELFEPNIHSLEAKFKYQGQSHSKHRDLWQKHHFVLLFIFIFILRVLYIGAKAKGKATLLLDGFREFNVMFTLSSDKNQRRILAFAFVFAQRKWTLMLTMSDVLVLVMTSELVTTRDQLTLRSVPGRASHTI